MNSTLTIAWREYRAYFTSPIAYVYLVTFLVAANWLFFRGFFIMGQADMRAFFETLPWMFLFFVPCVTMGKWAEEKRQGTLETLFTLPIRDSEIVAGKFFAALGLVTTALTLTLPAAFTVAVVGDMDWGPVIGGYLGGLFLAGAYVSLGLMVSALTDSQIIAFIGGVAASFFMLIIGTPLIAGSGATPMSRIVSYLGLGSHFASVSRGVIDSRDIVYYISFIAIFAYLNFRAVRAKR